MIQGISQTAAIPQSSRLKAKAGAAEPSATQLPSKTVVTYSAKNQPAFTGQQQLAAWQKMQLAAKLSSQSAPQFGNMQSQQFFQGDLILGQHPSDPYLDKLDYWRQEILNQATMPRPGFPNGWLQPFDTKFVMVNQVDLLEAAAREGFMSRYNHWVHGQAFNDLYQPQKHELSTLYELVINTNPSYAYLLNKNPMYAQKVVMAHVYGHTDFFKNNRMFQETNRHMHQVMGRHKRRIEQYMHDPRIQRQVVNGVNPVETFLDHTNSVRWLIDLERLSPRPLMPQGVQPSQWNQPEDNIPSVDMKEVRGNATEWMDRFLISKKERKQHAEKLLQEQEAERKRFPSKPDRDVLGFIIEHSKSLAPWQRDVLTMMREESYYFVPQMRTKIMNEGWASFWHTKLMQETGELVDPSETTNVCKMIAGVFTPNPQGVNPYLLGYEVYKDIYEKNGGGNAGLNAINQVRAYEDDTSFIRKHLSTDVMERMNLYAFKEKEDRQGGVTKTITSKDLDEVRSQLLTNLANGGNPIIEVVDGNFDNTGQLRLKHEHLQDLDDKYAVQVIKIMESMWGRPVHLDTVLTKEEEVPSWKMMARAKELMEKYPGKSPQEIQAMILAENTTKTPIRYTSKEGKVTIYELDKDGKAAHVINGNGERQLRVK